MSKKTMSSVAQMMLSLPRKGDEELVNPSSFTDMKDANLTIQETIIAIQINKALAGDTKAAMFLNGLVTSGEASVDEEKVTPLSVIQAKRAQRLSGTTDKNRASVQTQGKRRA